MKDFQMQRNCLITDLQIYVYLKLLIKLITLKTLVSTKVKRKNRYISVSWPYYDFQEKLEYKARLAGDSVIYVDPRYTSQICPICHHIEKSTRDRSKRMYTCKHCGYRSNDDRIGAMNIYQRGVDKIKKVVG